MPSLPQYGVTGRGYLTAKTLVPDAHATATANFFAVDSGGTDLPGSIFKDQRVRYAVSMLLDRDGTLIGEPVDDL